MKREKEVPESLFSWLEAQEKRSTSTFNNLNLFCSMPVRAVKMKLLNDDDTEEFGTAIIPAVDIYITERAILKEGFFKRDALYFFISKTHMSFPYGHIFVSSGSICLGNIFVPSAIPERSPAIPIETLFLHNDRNLSHGNSHLVIDDAKATAIAHIMDVNRVRLSRLAKDVVNNPGSDIIARDQIWCLSADVAKQKSLPEALCIMKKIYDVVFDVK